MACLEGYFTTYRHDRNIKSTYVGYHHVEGFLDCSMYTEDKWGLEIVTWVEKPCSYWTSLIHPKTPSNLMEIQFENFFCPGVLWRVREKKFLNLVFNKT